MLHSIKEERIVRRSLAVLTGVVGALTLMPASAAFAGTYTLGGDSAHGGNRLTYHDAAGETTNNVSVRVDGNNVVLTDTGAGSITRPIATDPVTGQPVIDPATGQPKPRGIPCTESGNTITCSMFAGGQTLEFLAIDTGDGDDTITNDTDIASDLNGEKGNDTINGGGGPDTLNGDGGLDTLSGRGGDDLIDTDGHIPGGFSGEADVVSCGDGNDTARIDARDTVDQVAPPYTANVNGPTSCETVFFEGTQAGTTPEPTPQPPGGGPQPTGPPVPQQAPGTRLLRLPAGTPRPLPRGGCRAGFLGNARSNRIIGNAGGDRMFGRGGADVLFGLAGGDCLFGEFGADRLEGGAGPDLILAGPGNDFVNGGSGNDRIYGQGGRDRIFGGTGRDRIYVGSGVNRVDAGPGKDLVVSRNGRRDIVRCGLGRDTVQADRRDRLIGCERKR